VIDDLAKKRAEKLTDKGIEHLEAGRYQEAIKVAAELEDPNGPMAFYLAAQAYAAMNDMKTAVATMRRSVLRNPTIWMNWFLLGTYLRNLQKYDEALAAYDQALLCPQFEADEVYLNMAMVAIDCREYHNALTYLDRVDAPSMRWDINGLRVLALEGVGSITEAAELAEEFLKERSEDDDYKKRAGFVAAALARIRLRQGRSKEEVRTFLFQCLEEYGSNSKLLQEIANLKELRYSEDSKYFRFLIQASLPVGHPWHREARGYGVVYDVVADTESHALDMINDFESAIGIESFEVLEIQIKEERPQDPMAIYGVSERLFC